MEGFSSVLEGMGNILKKKEIGIAAGIILLGLIASGYLFQEQQKKIKKLKNEISLEEQKISLGKELAVLNDKITKTSSQYVRKAASLTIDKFNDFASESKVKIVSIAPEKERDSGFYTVMPFRLKLQASYHRLGKFISILESLPDMVKIEDFFIRGEQAGSQAEAGKQEPGQKTTEQLKREEGDGKNNLNIDMKVSVTFTKAE